VLTTPTLTEAALPCPPAPLVFRDLARSVSVSRHLRDAAPSPKVSAAKGRKDRPTGALFFTSPASEGEVGARRRAGWGAAAGRRRVAGRIATQARPYRRRDAPIDRAARGHFPR